MKRSLTISFTLLIALVFQACRSVDPPVPDGEPDGLKVLAPPGFPPIPFPEGNEFTLERWELGKKLFYDPIMSVDSTVSCGSCHKAHLAFSDDQAFSPGVENRPGTRNAPPLTNLAYSPYFTREGGVPTLEMQVLVPIQEENEFDHNIVYISERLMASEEYVRMSYEAYDREPDHFVITRAISTFERLLISGNSPYDQWEHQGVTTALSAAQLRGKDLFFSDRTQCSQCHNGLNLTNHTFENNGLYEEYPDPGRERLTGLEEDRARFKVPTLRNIALTAPYMHDGSLASLEQVIDHYASGGEAHPNKSPLIQPLNLTAAEKEDLVAFLESLTDQEFISNPMFAE